MPRAWAAFSALAIWSMMSTAAAGSSGPAGDPLRQQLPFQQLHHEVRDAAVRDVEVEHLDDVRVAQRRRDLRFLLEARERVAVAHEAAMKQLHREAAGQARMSGEVDLAASAFREGTYDAIRPLQHDPDRQPAGGWPQQIPGELCVRFCFHVARLPNAASVPGRCFRAASAPECGPAGGRLTR